MNCIVLIDGEFLHVIYMYVCFQNLGCSQWIRSKEAGISRNSQQLGALPGRSDPGYHPWQLHQLLECRQVRGLNTAQNRILSTADKDCVSFCKFHFEGLRLSYNHNNLIVSVVSLLDTINLVNSLESFY